MDVCFSVPFFLPSLLSLGMIIAPELAKKVSGIVKAEGELGLHDAVAFMSPGNYTCISFQFRSDKKQVSDSFRFSMLTIVKMILLK